MLHRSLAAVALLLLFTAVQVAPAQETEIYPAVATASESQEYGVTVNGQSAFVEKYVPGPIVDDYSLEDVEEKITYHFVQFAIDGSATVKITAENDFGDFTLSPKSYGVEPSVQGNTMTFTLEEPRKLVLRKGSRWLYILGDPIDDDAPQPGDGNVVSLSEYDVDPSGQELNTYEIQKAIVEVATGPDAGGTLYVPEGVYKTGTLDLYSDVTLYLAPGAVLQASEDPQDFPLPFGPEYGDRRDYDHDDDVPPGPPGRDYGYDYALLKVHDVSDVAVEGPGILDAGGGQNGRLKIIHVENAKDLHFEDVTLRNGHGWMFPILDAEHVRINNLKLLSAITSNTDGINPDATTDIVVENSIVQTGDDCFAVKCTNFGNRLRDEVRDVIIRDNTTLNVKSALKIGTETRCDRFENIVFDSNDVVTSDRAFTIYLRDNAILENIYYTNNHVENAGGLRDDNNKIMDVAISQRDRGVIWQHPEWSEQMRNNPGQLRNLMFEGNTIDTDGTKFLETANLSGYDANNMISRVTFRDIVVNGELITDPGDPVQFGNEQSVPFLDIDTETVENVWFQGTRVVE